MAELKFTETAISKADGKSTERKPSEAVAKHIPMVKEMRATNTGRTVVLPYKTDEDKTEVKYLIADVQAAGRFSDCTVNKTITELSGNQAGKVSITFTARDKITQKRRKSA